MVDSKVFNFDVNKANNTQNRATDLKICKSISEPSKSSSFN